MHRINTEYEISIEIMIIEIKMYIKNTYTQRKIISFD